MNDSTLWFALTVGAVALVPVWFKLQALSLLAPTVGFSKRLVCTVAIALICFAVALVSAQSLGMVLTAPVVFVTENLLVLAYTWHYLPTMRTWDFWKELFTVRIPRWYESAKQLPSEFASLWFWMQQWRHMRQLAQPWRQDLHKSERERKGEARKGSSRKGSSRKGSWVRFT